MFLFKKNFKKPVQSKKQLVKNTLNMNEGINPKNNNYIFEKNL